MADTNHHSSPIRVEGDGVSYSSIVWFIVVLTATTLFCQALVWGMFEIMERRAASADAARAPLALPRAAPTIEGGRIVSGTESTLPQPALLVNEPLVLSGVRQTESTRLSTYGWISQGVGIAHMPIDHAKDLIVERGLPTRPGTLAPATIVPIGQTAAAPRRVVPVPAEPADGHGGGH